MSSATLGFFRIDADSIPLNPSKSFPLRETWEVEWLPPGATGAEPS